MAKGIPTDPKLKEEILKAIHDENMTAYKASQVFGISEWTINGWLKKSTECSERNYIAEINRLKKKLDNAYRVIGELATEVQRPKR